MKVQERKQDILFLLLWAGTLLGVHFLVWDEYLSDTKINRNFTEGIKGWLLGAGVVMTLLR